MSDFEKLGLFYLGRQRNSDLAPGNELLLYDSKDLTTHAVCVGMTGSGKTGLCLALLEEAAMDNVPAIVIDPKGDIANLLLTFPELIAPEFRPWIDESQATRAGMTPDKFAADQATFWKNGLASWGIEGHRIRQLREKIDLPIYTPGSTAGLPITVLRSFDAPNEAIRNDTDAFTSHIASASSGLLALLGIDADPVTSREHILISKTLASFWSEGKNLDLAGLIYAIQTPPFKTVGVLELDRFFAEKDRMALAMKINNLLASPTFASWLKGEPLDVKRLLHTPEGKPRISIMSISHLSDAERMFFVTTLLNEVLSWTRSQAGTSSLRAILYMDEVFGYFPPTKNPPSKTPMLTLLKQARAFGLGIVLATQNPVDLDYKGLSNTGTWFLGRLQTERDKARVLDGLEGASAASGASFDRARMEQTLSGLGKRVFVMNNVHDDGPVVFETRWAMSYLRGPLTRTHIQALMSEKKSVLLDRKPNGLETQKPLVTTDQETKKQIQNEIQERTDQSSSPPVLPKGTKQYFLSANVRAATNTNIVYQPAIFAAARLHFVKASYKVDHWEMRLFACNVVGNVPDDIWENAAALPSEIETDAQGECKAIFASLPDELLESKRYSGWEKQLKSFLYRTQDLSVFKCKELKVYSTAGESEGDFRVRLEQLVSEERDLETEKLRKKYAGKFSTLKSQMQRAQEQVEKEKGQYESRKMDSILSIGSSILGAVFGRKLASRTNISKAASSVRSATRAAKEKSDIGRAKEKLELLNEKLEQMEKEFENEVSELTEKLDVQKMVLEQLQVSPRKSDIAVNDFGVLWLPYFTNAAGIVEPAFEFSDQP